MTVIKEADFRRELKASPARGYLFFGEEDYLKSFAVRQAREHLCPDPTFAFFNDMRLDAVDFTPQKLLDALMPSPMMADRKLVTLTGLNFNTMRPEVLDELCEALVSLEEYDYNILIVQVAADCLDPGYLPKKPSSLLTRLGEHLTPVWFERCSTAKLSAWVGKHFAHNGVEAPPALCSFLPEYCGHSMFVLANEIDKLSFYVRSHGRTLATEEDLRLVCTPATEYDAFAFANAIMEGKNEYALGILADYRFRRIDPLMILGDVSRVICEMITVRAMTAEGAPTAEISAAFKPAIHEYKVGLYQKCLRNTSEKKLLRALDACNAADAELKEFSSRSAAQLYAPIEKLICAL